VASTLVGTVKAVLKLSCTFLKSATECGFAEQAKVPGRATIVNIARDGKTAVRLHTEPGDNNVAGSGSSERNDLWLSQSETGCYQGREQVWEHSILLPSDFAAPKGWYLLQQFHTTDNSGGQPNFAISVLPNLSGLVLWGYGGATISRGEPQYPGRFSVTTGPVTRNVWYDFVYHVKWSSGPDGFFDAWVNGEKKLSHRGPTLYAGIGCYLKLSNYHQAFGQASSVIHDRVIRYDVQ
jgi:hypothetical protein